MTPLDPNPRPAGPRAVRHDLTRSARAHLVVARQMRLDSEHPENVASTLNYAMSLTRRAIRTDPTAIAHPWTRQTPVGPVRPGPKRPRTH